MGIHSATGDSRHGTAPLPGIFAALSLMLLAGVSASADTVYLKDGSSLDGTLKYSDADKVVIEVGKGQMSLSTADVLRIEKNDKTGNTNSVSILRAKQHADALDQRTGLTAQQRDDVLAAMDPLWSPDEAQRTVARKKLLAMGKDMAVFKYLESYLPYAKDLVAPEIMKTLVEMDPAKAKDTVLSFTQNSSPVNRSKALELAASYKNDADLDTIARGLVDVDNTVRIAAAHAVAIAGGKRATPALIEELKSVDPRVRNASRETLKYLWSAGGVNVDLSTPEEWDAFWNGKAHEIKDPISVSTLTPLVSPEDLANATSSHDE